MEKTKRNVGLDLLRILSMIMIVFLHYIGKGSLLRNTELFSMNNNIVWLIESFCIVAVNCYVLISGYFLVKSKFTFKKIIKLWGQVLFYSISVFIILFLCGQVNVNIKNILNSFLPVITTEYWFITAYIIMYLLSPFLNMIIDKVSKNEYRILLVIMLITFCFLPTFLPSEFLTNGNTGYSIMWFITLYFLSGYIRIYANDIKSNKNYLLKYIVCALILFFLRTLAVSFLIKINRNIDIAGKLYMYNSIFVLVPSIFLFRYFKNLNVKDQTFIKLITNITPYTLAVYLIHEQPCLRNILYENILHISNFTDKNYMIFIAFGSVVSIFLICICIDTIRHKICVKFSNTKFIINIQTKFENLFITIISKANKIIDKCE